MDKKIMSVKDLVEHLQRLPQDAELFYYGGLGGFLSLDTSEEIQMYFKLSEDGSTLFIDYRRYEVEDDDRITQGKEWSDLIE